MGAQLELDCILQSISCSIEGISAKRLHASKRALWFFEVAFVLVRLDLVAHFIVNAGDSMLWSPQHREFHDDLI